MLHFIGHGWWDEDAQDGALALEGAGGDNRLVTGRDLGVMLCGHRSLRLVVLNACEGARSARDDPFGGGARRWCAGMPAVIAMQFEISDQASWLVFGRSLSTPAIADDLPIDVAMVEDEKGDVRRRQRGRVGHPGALPALTGRQCLYDEPDLRRRAPGPGKTPSARPGSNVGQIGIRSQRQRQQSRK